MIRKNPVLGWLMILAAVAIVALVVCLAVKQYIG